MKNIVTILLITSMLLYIFSTERELRSINEMSDIQTKIICQALLWMEEEYTSHSSFDPKEKVFDLKCYNDNQSEKITWSDKYNFYSATKR